MTQTKVNVLDIGRVANTVGRYRHCVKLAYANCIYSHSLVSFIELSILSGSKLFNLYQIKSPKMTYFSKAVQCFGNTHTQFTFRVSN